MILRLFPFEFPYIWGKFYFLFFQCPFPSIFLMWYRHFPNLCSGSFSSSFPFLLDSPPVRVLFAFLCNFPYTVASSLLFLVYVFMSLLLPCPCLHVLTQFFSHDYNSLSVSVWHVLFSFLSLPFSSFFSCLDESEYIEFVLPCFRLLINDLCLEHLLLL